VSSGCNTVYLLLQNPLSNNSYKPSVELMQVVCPEDTEKNLKRWLHKTL